jgi:23S rRNA (guanosine2251-2'-O)-methyltransferase
MSPRRTRGGAERDARAEIVFGVRPVQELLGRRAGVVERIFVARGRGGGLGRILREAREAGIPVTHLSKELLAKKAGPGATHQGVAAQVAPIAYTDADSLCAEAASRPDGLLVLVDRVVDPGNLGAVLRTAAAAGATGVLLGSEGTAGLSPAVAKASAGAVERIRVARESKPARRLEQLREAGFTTLALEPRGGHSWDRVPLVGRVVLVVGGEARGPRPAVSRACDIHVAIPLAGGIDSLNVAVAAGVLLFELVRQRRAAKGGLETSEPR